MVFWRGLPGMEGLLDPATDLEAGRMLRGHFGPVCFAQDKQERRAELRERLVLYGEWASGSEYRIALFDAAAGRFVIVS
jgi:hypothetical protein